MVYNGRVVGIGLQYGLQLKIERFTIKFMAQIYKVLEDFEFDGVVRKRGEEIACRAREAEKLIREKKLIPSKRELDPNDTKDAALKAEADKRATDKNKELNDDAEARKDAKTEEQGKKDEVRGEKVAKATELSIKKRGEPHAAIEGMTEEELDKEIANLEALPDIEPPQDEKKDEAPVETPKPRRTRTA